MKLPQIDLPLFETKLPSTGEAVKYRPFTVKEEKILLIAQESQDSQQMVLAMSQIITNCCPNIDVSTLPMFDLEYIMLQIRAKSVNNQITFTVSDPDTDMPVEIVLDVEDIILKKHDDHSREITITEDVYLMMRYPRLDEVSIFMNYASDNTKTLFDVMIACIETVVVGDEVQKLSDYSKDEVDAFIETFPGDALTSLQKFFETIPTLRFETSYTNSEGVEKEIVLEGTETFFL
tara:strand:+ start:627 stop:1328 length:702 start_codon:yes stop_codon:yes gene_type:complete